MPSPQRTVRERVPTLELVGRELCTVEFGLVDREQRGDVVFRTQRTKLRNSFVIRYRDGEREIFVQVGSETDRSGKQGVDMLEYGRQRVETRKWEVLEK